MILVLSNPRRKSRAAISKESSLSAGCSNRPGYECRCAFSAGLVDVLSETLVGDIHLAQSGQNFRCAGVEMVSDELLQLADRVLHLRRGRRKIFQLTQLCELSRQLGKITSRTVLFALLVFLISDRGNFAESRRFCSRSDRRSSSRKACSGDRGVRLQYTECAISAGEGKICAPQV